MRGAANAAQRKCRQPFWDPSDVARQTFDAQQLAVGVAAMRVDRCRHILEARIVLGIHGALLFRGAFARGR
jgi:hypothetical protein